MDVSQGSLDGVPGSAAPAAVQALQWAWTQQSFFNRNAKRYGEVFRIRFPFMYGGKIICFATASAAKQILAQPPSVAHAGEAYAILRQSTGPHAVIVLDEEEHLRLRKIVLSPLHGERLRQWESFAEQRTLEDVATWPIGEEFSLRPITERIAMAVILKIVFGMRDPARSDELRGLLPVLFDIAPLVAPGYITKWGRLDLGPLSPWGRYRRKRDRIDELIYTEIAERRREFETVQAQDASTESRSDLLSMLLDARGDDGRRMTDEELRDQMVTMLVAGHETTATSIAWALERLLRTPVVLELLLERLDEGDTTYLDAVIKETMRIRPVVAQIGRVFTEERVIDGWTVPAGSLVIVPMTVIHMDPLIYPQPKQFRPERFLDGNDPGNYSWLPFGGGVRRCPGASLALMEMRVILTAILRSVRMRADRPESEKPTVRGITIIPNRGGRIVVTERLRPQPLGRQAEALA
jgi:cytochrome P450 family 135